MDTPDFSALAEQLVAHQRSRVSVVAMNAWFDLGRPQKVPLGDKGTELLLRATCHLLGFGGCSVEPRKARRLLLKAEQYPKSRGDALLLRAHGPFLGMVDLDYSQAGRRETLLGMDRFLREAAAAGNVQALSNLMAGRGTRDMAGMEKVDLDRLLAEFTGVKHEALYRAGLAVDSTFGDVSYDLFVRALAEGSLYAHYEIYKILSERGDTQRAEPALARGAQMGEPLCCFMMADRIYKAGPKVDADYDLALRYARVAAHYGLLPACGLYGLLLHANPKHRHLPECFSALLLGSIAQSDYTELARSLAHEIAGYPTEGKLPMVEPLNWLMDQLDDTRYYESMSTISPLWQDMVFTSSLRPHHS